MCTQALARCCYQVQNVNNVSPAHVSAVVLRPGGSGLDCRTLPRVLQASTRFSFRQRNRDKQDACRWERGKRHDSGQQVTQHMDETSGREQKQGCSQPSVTHVALQQRRIICAAVRQQVL